MYDCRPESDRLEWNMWWVLPYVCPTSQSFSVDLWQWKRIEERGFLPNSGNPEKKGKKEQHHTCNQISFVQEIHIELCSTKIWLLDWILFSISWQVRLCSNGFHDEPGLAISMSQVHVVTKLHICWHGRQTAECWSCCCSWVWTFVLSEGVDLLWGL